MNTKPIPPFLALIAGGLVCIMSFVQQVDMVLFARHFIIATIVFFILGVIAKIVLDKFFEEDDTDFDDDEAEDEDDYGIEDDSSKEK